MSPQHVADRDCPSYGFESFETQRPRDWGCGYLFDVKSSYSACDCTQAVITSNRGQAGPSGLVGSFEPDRRTRCPRASSFLPRSGFLQRFRRAQRPRPKKSLWLSTQSRSATSLHRPANTSKLKTGRASASAPFLAMQRGVIPC